MEQFWDHDEDYVVNFLYDSAHDIQDMLIECTWRYADKCDYRNFTRTLTDWGVCYTFNSPNDTNKILKVNQPGSKYGLFMRLYVEQEEYTSSENTGAGFKV